MTQETGPKRHPAEGVSPRAVALGGGVLLVVFLALGIWAVTAPGPGSGPEDPPPSVTGKRPDPPAPVPADPPPSKVEPEARTPATPAPASGEPLLLKPARDLGTLLGQKFQFTRQDGKPAFAQLRAALGHERAVTILNVWAPYCEPCKREFPAFRALQENWGDQVRFLPIQLGEGDPGELAAIMPRAPHHLIDYEPGGAVQNSLAALGLLPPNAPIPITLLLDCRHQLRWLSAREITDIDGFDQIVAELRRELDTPACARPAPSPSAPGTPHCGNGRCETLAHKEDCLSCPADCGCKPGQLCATQTGDRLGHVCMDELQ